MKSKKHLLVAIAVVTLAAGTAQQANPSRAQSRPEKPTSSPQTREERRKLSEVRVKQGLREAAKLDGGGYVESVKFNDELDAGSVDLLANISKVVVRGLVTSNRALIVRSAQLGYDEPIETIVTDYTVAVFDVYKGDVGLLSRNITVRIPGGRVEFEDGHWAEMRALGFSRPMDQDEFIMFLNPHSSEENVYSVTFGRQGLFELKPGGRVVPRANRGSSLAKNARKDYSEFVKHLNDLIAREKGRDKNDQ